jgi:hypothetical protein
LQEPVLNGAIFVPRQEFARLFAFITNEIRIGTIVPQLFPSL